MRIEGGNSGNQANVTDDNQLDVFAVCGSELEWRSDKGRGYAAYSGSVTETNGSETLVVHATNNSSTHHMHIASLCVTADGNGELFMYIGTPTVSGGYSTTVRNLNTGASIASDVAATTGQVAGGTVSGGNIIWGPILGANGGSVDSRVCLGEGVPIIAPGDAIGVTFKGDGTSTIIKATLTFYMET